MKPVEIWVNGQPQSRSVEPRTHLADFLRDDCRLTGTHIGCEHGVCGACTVLIDGRPARSCITFAVACDGSRVTTVEGYDDDPVMVRLRAAFTAHHALQCGYCTPGMLATARDIVLRWPDADEARVRHELAGNLCRCTGYMGIVAAIRAVLASCRETPDPAIESLRTGVVGLRAPAPVPPTGAGLSGERPAPARPVPSEHAAAPLPAGPGPSTSLPADAPSTAGRPAAAPSGLPAADAGRTVIQGAFDVAAAAADVWAFMSDLPKVAACLPGAELTGQQGDRLDGRIAIRFGPIHANFAGSATLQRDDATRTATLSGSGQDAGSRSLTQADVRYRLLAPVPGRTRVEVDLAYALQGPLAQFSRSGLVRDLVGRLITEFGANVERALAARAGGGTAAPAPAGAVKLNAGRLLAAVLMDRLRRWFGGKS